MLRYYYSQVADWVALENDRDNVGSRLANNHSEHEKHHSAESGVGCETKVKCKRGCFDETKCYVVSQCTRPYSLLFGLVYFSKQFGQTLTDLQVMLHFFCRNRLNVSS